MGVKIRFKELGPLVVGMDAKGNSQFEKIRMKSLENKKKILAKIDA